MALPDFANYSDEKLEDARLAILNERERRERLASIPTQVADLVNRYVDDGGSKDDIIEAL